MYKYGMDGIWVCNVALSGNVSLLFVVVEWLRRERAHGPAEAEAAPEGPDEADDEDDAADGDDCVVHVQLRDGRRRG